MSRFGEGMRGALRTVFHNHLACSKRLKNFIRLKKLSNALNQEHSYDTISSEIATPITEQIFSEPLAKPDILLP